MIPENCKPKLWWREMLRKAMIRADYSTGKEQDRFQQLVKNIMVRIKRKGYGVV